MADRAGLPVAVHGARAAPSEVTLGDAPLHARCVAEAPRRRLGDKAYDSDALDARLQTPGIELLAPHRANRTTRTQAGRPLRRYRRRWKIERLFRWLSRFRRLPVRYEYHLEHFLAFVHLAWALMLLQRCL